MKICLFYWKSHWNFATWFETELSFRFCLPIFQLLRFSALFSVIFQHTQTCQDSCLLSLPLSALNEVPNATNVFDLFHTFTENISNKIEHFHNSYTKRFFDLMNMKNFILAPLKLDSFECSCFFITSGWDTILKSFNVHKMAFSNSALDFYNNFSMLKNFLQHRLSLTLFKQGLLQKVTFLQLQKYTQNVIKGQVSGHPSNTAGGRQVAGSLFHSYGNWGMCFNDLLVRRFVAESNMTNRDRRKEESANLLQLSYSIWY